MKTILSPGFTKVSFLFDPQSLPSYQLSRVGAQIPQFSAQGRIHTFYRAHPEEVGEEHRQNGIQQPSFAETQTPSLS